MMRSIAAKWLLMLMFTSTAGLLVAGLFIRQFTLTEYDRLLAEQSEAVLVEEIARFYEENNGRWRGVEELFRRNPGRDDVNQLPFVIVDDRGIVVWEDGPHERGRPLPRDMVERGTPVMVDGRRVGTVVVLRDEGRIQQQEAAYTRQTNQALAMGVGGAILVSLVVGLLLSRHFTRPLRELKTAIHAMNQGQVGAQVPVRTRDELGELATAFNHMSAELEKVNSLRRQMTADIAHDLRTPLAVLLGYLEGLRDGTLQPGSGYFDTMYDEGIYLQRLIDDLRTLSLADAGELSLMKQAVNPGDLLQHTRSAFQQQASEQQVDLHIDNHADGKTVQVDRNRMQQVLGNLVSNALRYTPPSGRITLYAASDDRYLHLMVEDTGSGIAPEKLPYIFERFYRADEARQQHQGESGLGLAIVRSIVMAHGGTIEAESQPGRGTRMRITLPAG
jgi:signal transduction histidine kinase